MPDTGPQMKRPVLHSLVKRVIPLASVSSISNVIYTSAWSSPADMVSKG
jgi:hypothetical protein